MPRANHCTPEYWEHDVIYADGTALGELEGVTGDWSITSFTVDPTLLVDGQLDIWMDIDVTHTERAWSVEIDWSKLTVEWEWALVLSATIDIDPDTLNVVSNGQWITAYIELPSGYDVADISVASIELSCDVTAGVDPADPTEIGDYDSDGIPDLMVKFDRLALVTYIDTYDFDDADGRFYDLPITITGMVAGTPFEGTDTIRVRI